MKWFNIFFGVWYIGQAIATWCGYPPSNLSIGCGFFCAAIGFFSWNLLD